MLSLLPLFIPPSKNIPPESLGVSHSPIGSVVADIGFFRLIPCWHINPEIVVVLSFAFFRIPPSLPQYPKHKLQMAAQINRNLSHAFDVRCDGNSESCSDDQCNVKILSMKSVFD